LDPININPEIVSKLSPKLSLAEVFDNVGGARSSSRWISRPLPLDGMLQIFGI